MKKNGEWVEIDNTLVNATKMGNEVSAAIVRNDQMVAVATATETDAKDVVTTAYYENNDNPFKVQLPAAINKNAPIAVTHGEHSLRFCFDGVVGTSSSVLEQPFTEQEKTAQLRNQLSAATDEQAKLSVDKEHAMTAWKNRSAVTFASVQPNVDLQYHVSGKKLKETLVLQQVPTALSFSFTFTYSGLQAVLQEDNSVQFMGENGEVAFIIAAPYMFDDGEGYSTDIAVTLQETVTGCRYTLTPDRAWLTDIKRVYPVTLDPTVTATQNSSYIQDAGVQQSNPDTSYNYYDRIYVGSGPNSTRGVMYFQLLQWPSGAGLDQSGITKAELRLNYYPTASWQTGYNFTIEAYRLPYAWPTTNTTWNNTKDVYGIQVSSLKIGDARQKTSGYDTYDVTNWVLYRYGTTNTDFGLRLQPAAVSSSINRVCYISSDYAETAKRPLLVIQYRLPYILLEQYYDQAFSNKKEENNDMPLQAVQRATVPICQYFSSVFGIDIQYNISQQVSPGDLCTHKTSIDICCRRTITSGVCSQHATSNNFHCTHSGAWLEVLPNGQSIENIETNVCVVKWTGHPMCEGCTGANNTFVDVLGLNVGRQIAINYFGDGHFTVGFSDALATVVLFHEFGHYMGCEGDTSDSCTNSNCIMTYECEISEEQMLTKIQNRDTDVYCSACRDTILRYKRTNL